MHPRHLPLLTALFSLAACMSQPDSQMRPANIIPPPYPAEAEAKYAERLAQYRGDIAARSRLANYDPVEIVPGAKTPARLPQTTGTPFSPDALAKADAYAAARKSSVLLIAQAGKLASAHYYGDFTQDTPLVAKSFAKQTAAMALGRAIALRSIKSLDEPAATYIKEWRTDPQKSKITIRYLIENRSGLMPQDFSPSAPDVLQRGYLHPRHDSVLVYEYPVTDEPGTRFEYSNANSEIIAIIIERATGRRYANFLGEELLRPIGATGGTVWVDRPGGLAHSGCCQLLPAETWVRLGMLLLQNGNWDGQQLLPESYVKDMKTANPQNPYYGAGIYVAGRYIKRRGYLNPENDLGKVLHSAPYLDKDITLFDGNGNQVMYLIPSTQTVILRMGEFPPAEKPWDNSYLPNLLIKDTAAQTKTPLPLPQPR